MSHPVKLLVLESKWAAQLVAVAQARGILCHTVYPNGAGVPRAESFANQGWTLFARLNQSYPEEGRNFALQFLSAGGKCIQSIEDIRCYENRAYQMGLLEEWYPRGVVLRSQEEAVVEAAIQELGLPIVSKSRFGSSSKTVRQLHARADVYAEVREVFGQGKWYGDKLQHAECLWQAMCHGNEFALRIARVTKEWGWAFKVMNRPHDWRASGSGVCVPLTEEELGDDKYRKAFATFTRMADKSLGSKWCAADLLFDKVLGNWLVVDVTLAWNMSRKLIGANYDAPVLNLYTRERHPKGLYGRHQWDILLDDLEAGRE